MTTDKSLECLTQLYGLFNLRPDEPLSILPAAWLAGAHHTRHNPAQTCVIMGVYRQEELASLVTLLGQVYPKNHSVKVVSYSGDSVTDPRHLALGDLIKSTPITEGASLSLCIPPLAHDNSFEEFQEIIAHLRAPNGCPWDREQTHLSLRTSLLEETYETLEAIDREDSTAMCEEFGDLLLQIVLNAQIAAEAGEFHMEDVIAGITRKIIRRHPHVFSEVEVTGVQNVLLNWEKLKQQERVDNGTPEKGLLDSVPIVLPSLTQSQELQSRAARVGFDWPSIEPVWEKVSEELDEVRHARTADEIEKELGDLLFAVVNLVRWFKVDAESALRGTNQKFRRRFQHIEKSARNTGRELHTMTLDEMDEYWNEAKGFE